MKSMNMVRCPKCNGDDLIGGGFHSPGSIERCRQCAAPAVEVVQFELCATKCDAGYGPYNSDWVVVREDDPQFDELLRTGRHKMRPILNAGYYGGATRYDFNGPC